MKHWTPLWDTIVTSTLWSESKEVRLLFVTMLALKDQNGNVFATTAGLKRLANLDSFEETAAAIKVLESPDTETDTPQEFEGRRIQRIDGGWKILNHSKHRDMIDVTRREYQRLKQAEYRAKKKKLAPVKDIRAVGEQQYVNEHQSNGVESADKLLERAGQ